jgi:predicted nucleic acid-binding protein
VNAYFDTSALVKLYATGLAHYQDHGIPVGDQAGRNGNAQAPLDEDGSEQAMTLFAAAEVAITSALAFVEVRAALAAAVRAGRLEADAFETAKADLQTLSETFAVIDPGGVLRAAADTAERHALRAYDAVHLATALAVAADDLVFVCWDADLSAAASRAGLTVAGGEPPAASVVR